MYLKIIKYIGIVKIYDLIKGKYYTNCHNTFLRKGNISYIHNNIPSNDVDQWSCLLK